MLHLRITTPSDLIDQVVEALSGDPAVSQIAVIAGAAVQPPGDIVLADVAREAVNEIMERLDAWLNKIVAIRRVGGPGLAAGPRHGFPAPAAAEIGRSARALRCHPRLGARGARQRRRDLRARAVDLRTPAG